MTESQLKSFPSFKDLPIYDESDARANSIVSRPEIRECSTIQQVEDCIHDPHLIPLGGLRAKTNGGHIVIAYFGRRPPGKPSSQ